MRYFRITCSNGYCGCSEDFYEELEDDTTLATLAEDILYNSYSFSEPDGRFLTHASDFDDYEYDEYEEDYDEYMENLCVDWEEISEEEYRENQ